MKTNVSVIYVYYNTPSELIDSVRSVRKVARGVACEIIVIDNNSPKPIPDEIMNDSAINIVRNKTNRGYGRALNQGAKMARGKYLLFLNPDITVLKGSILDMVSYMEKHPKVGIIGPKMKDRGGEVLPTVTKLPLLPDVLIAYSFLHKLFPNNPVSRRFFFTSNLKKKVVKAPMVGGACMFVRKDAFEKIGGFDEQFFMYFEESDLCLRMQKRGYDVVYYPEVEILHIVGQSTTDKTWIKGMFERSRYVFLRKHHGILASLLAEGFFRISTKENVLLAGVIALSSFLHFYRLSDWMMFQGDFGRDYLVAREALIHRTIPLVGITSSVTWLHQGPLSVWFIMLSLFVGSFHPASPAYLYAGFGVLATVLTYYLGKIFFNTKVGILGAAFFATSPFILVSNRMPYHTAPIPLFSAFAFLILWYYIRGRKFPFLLGLTFGLLFLLELSNVVAVGVALLTFVTYRVRIVSLEVIRILLGFLTGISPFLLYDLSRGFLQTFGFTLWVVNRIRLALGLTLSGDSTTASIPSAMVTVWDYLRRIFYPQDTMVVVAIFIVIVIVCAVRKAGYRTRHSNGLFLVILWILLPLIGYVLHTTPGMAYFPFLFIPLCLLTGFVIWTLGETWKGVYLIFSLLVFFNGFYTLSNQYFLDSIEKKGSEAPGWNYGLSPTLETQVKQVEKIIALSDQSFTIAGGGFWSKFPSAIDNYRYLFLWKGAAQDGTTRYVFYHADDPHLPQGIPLFRDSFIHVYWYE